MNLNVAIAFGLALMPICGCHGKSDVAGEPAQIPVIDVEPPKPLDDEVARGVPKEMDFSPDQTSQPSRELTAAPNAHVKAKPDGRFKAKIGETVKPNNTTHLTNTPTSLALFAVQKIEDVGARKNALFDIVLAVSKAEDKKQVLTDLRQVVEATHTMKAPNYEAEVLCRIASALANAGDFEKATQVARRIEEPSNRVDVLNSIAIRRSRLTGGLRSTSIKVDALNSIALAMAQSGAKQESLATLKQATEVARRIKEPNSKANALIGIASAMAQSEAKQEALATLNQAKEVARRIEEPSNKKVDSLRRIAMALAREGAINEAVELAQQFADQSQKAEVFESIAVLLVRRADNEQALTTLEQPMVTAARLAEELDIGAYDFDALAHKAVEAAQQVEEPSNKGIALKSIAMALANGGATPQALATLEQAVEAAPQIKEPSNRANALKCIAMAFAKGGDTPQALATLEQAVEAARQIEEPSNRANALRSITMALARSREINKGVKVASQFKTALAQASALRDIASALTRAGETKQTVEVAQKIDNARPQASASPDIASTWSPGIKQAVEVAQQIENELAHAPRDIASILAPEIKQAAKVLQEVRGSEAKVAALCAISMAFADEGDKDQALATLEQAAEVARIWGARATRNDNGVAPLAFFDPLVTLDLSVSSALAKVGDVARQFDEPEKKANALERIAVVLSKGGDKDQALVTLEQAVEVARQIEEPSKKANALNSIASAFAESGANQRALATLDQALKAIQQIEDERKKETALWGITMTLSTEPVRVEERRVRRMKQTFAAVEKQLGQKLVEAINRKSVNAEIDEFEKSR